jgi:outer membrane protein assembly factor BamB
MIFVHHTARASLLLAFLLSGLQFSFSQFPFQQRPTDKFELSEQIDIKDLPNEAANHLARAEALLADEKWDEAIETLRRLSEDHGERILQLDDRRFTNIRDFCHLQLAALPASARQLYRDRVDTVAKGWYESGIRNRDGDLLRRVVDELFCSSYGDDALMALGEIALEKGKFGLARWYWERIDPRLRSQSGLPIVYELNSVDLDEQWSTIRAQFEKRPEAVTWLAYPDSEIDLASVRARLVLVSILEGAVKRATLELNAFGRLHADAEGPLAGKSGSYATNLAALLESSQKWPAQRPSTDWTTFAGSSQRTVSRLSPISIGLRPAWQLDLGHIIKADPNDSRIRRGGPDRDLSVHPLVVGNHVLLGGRDQVYAYSLETGEGAFSESGQIFPGGDAEPPAKSPKRSALSEPRFTMTVDGHRLFTRIGTQVTVRRPTPFPTRHEGNRLVCLRLDKQGAQEWQYPLGGNAETEFDLGKWAFEGPPISDGNFVYVALRRSEARPEAHIACIEARPPARLVWQRKICTADTPGHGQVNELTHNLLTLAEGTLYYNTNSGAVAAISAHDGTVRWVYRYQRARSGDMSEAESHFYRDLSPCIYHQGLVIAAPSDSPRVVALDAGTGKLVWHADLPTTVHLLGVAGGNLIATGAKVWWIDALEGRVLDVWPHPTNRAAVRGYGRGVLAGGRIYWPTRERIYVFDQSINRKQPRPWIVPRPPIDLDPGDLQNNRPPITAGNLVVAKGKLLIATHDTLYAFDLLSP